MATLARIRRLPSPPAAAEPTVDLVLLGELYRQARVDDRSAYDKRRRGEDIIRVAYGEGVPVVRLVAVTGLSKQRVGQILRGPTVKPLEESNGQGSS